jgi:hypothetical protein
MRDGKAAGDGDLVDLAMRGSGQRRESRRANPPASASRRLTPARLQYFTGSPLEACIIVPFLPP